MNSKILKATIFTTLLLLAIVLVLILSREDKVSSPSMIRVDEYWSQVGYPSEGVYIAIPTSWRTVFYEDLSRGVVSLADDGQRTFAEIYLYLENKSPRTEQDFIVEHPNYSVSPVELGKSSGVKYFGQMPPLSSFFGDSYEGFPSGNAEDDNSYIVGVELGLKERRLNYKCRVYGPSYSEYISDCNNIVDTLVVR